MRLPTTSQHRFGFTLVELVVVVGLIAFMAGLALPRLGAFSGRQQLEQAGLDLRSVLADARSRSATATQMGGQDVEWGVSTETNSYSLGWRPVGLGASDVLVSLRTYQLPSGVALSPANAQTVFSRLSGTASEGARAYTLTKGSETVTVTVASNGKIEID